MSLPGVDLLDLEPGIEAAHAFDEGRAIDREAAARRRGTEAHFHGLRSCLMSLGGQRREKSGTGEEVSAQRQGMVSADHCSAGLRP